MKVELELGLKLHLTEKATRVGGSVLGDGHLGFLEIEFNKILSLL